MTVSEHQIQAAYFQHLAWEAGKQSGLSKIYAIPNGAWYGDHPKSYAIGMKLREEGLKSGIPDVFLPFMRGGHGGAFIEFKTDKGSLSDEQRARIQGLEEEGYVIEVCRSETQAWEFTKAYLAGRL